MACLLFLLIGPAALASLLSFLLTLPGLGMSYCFSSWAFAALLTVIVSKARQSRGQRQRKRPRWAAAAIHALLLPFESYASFASSTGPFLPPALRTRPCQLSAARAFTRGRPVPESLMPLSLSLPPLRCGPSAGRCWSGSSCLCWACCPRS